MSKRSGISLVKWLHGLESSPRLLAAEAKTKANIDWCKGVLERWKSAGYPDPESWPEIASAPQLHPSYRLNHNEWPDPPKGNRLGVGYNDGYIITQDVFSDCGNELMTCLTTGETISREEFMKLGEGTWMKTEVILDENLRS